MMRSENDIQRDRTEFTPSSLLECDRRTVLYTSQDHYVAPDHRWNLLRGEMVHALVEAKGRYPKDSVLDLIREERFSTIIETQYGPQIFSGKPDLVIVQRVEDDGVAYVKIVDYKTSTIDHALVEAKRTHQMQLNMYAYLVAQALPDWLLNQYFSINSTSPLAWVDSVVITELEIVYVDMKKVRRFTSEGPLTTKGKLISRVERAYETLFLSPIHLLPLEETEQWVRQRIEEKIRAKEVMPPPLEGDAAWICPYCPMQEVCVSLASQEREGA